jgi:ankyrin repeat protein
VDAVQVQWSYLLFHLQGIGVNLRNNSGETALFKAAFFNRIECAMLLERDNINVNILDRDGWT